MGEYIAQAALFLSWGAIGLLLWYNRQHKDLNNQLAQQVDELRANQKPTPWNKGKKYTLGKRKQASIHEVPAVSFVLKDNAVGHPTEGFKADQWERVL